MEQAEIRETALRALAALGRLPSAPYHEDRGADYIAEFCENAGLVVEVDHWGNVLASRPGSTPDAPGLAFVAHMDHPGFEAVEADGYSVLCNALGGIPTGALEPGVPVLLLRPDGRRVKGVTEGALPISEDAIDTPTRDRSIMVRVETRLDTFPCPVVFDLPDFDLTEDRVTMRALDDLAGCAATMGALKAAASFETPGTVYGLFTRAEEVGLVGARLAAEDGLLPRSTVVVSVESSRTLPGAEIGRGPVIRVGDAMSTFSNAAEAYLLTARDRLRESLGTFNCQRQLMSGGTCEGSAFSAFGYAATGVAFPLGNYHNGGANGQVEAEYIALSDFAGGAMLLAETARLAGKAPQSRSMARIQSRPVEEARRLAAEESR